MSDNKLDQLLYITNHIFLPLKLPQEDDHHPENDRALCTILLHSATIYRQSLPLDAQIRWGPIEKMLQSLDKLHDSNVLRKDSVKMVMTGMQPGGMLLSLFCRKNTNNSETC
jgi:hypothetical protein